jgi:hypothetical protein
MSVAERIECNLVPWSPAVEMTEEELQRRDWLESLEEVIGDQGVAGHHHPRWPTRHV